MDRELSTAGRQFLSVMRWFVLAVIVCGFLVVNLVTPFSFNGGPEWPLAIALGICIGQINLTATWAALAPGNIVVRLPWALLLNVLMWYALVLGNRWESPYFSLAEAVQLGVILLGALIVAQIPLWVAGRVFRWRLASWAGESSDAGGEGFTFHIWHAMAGMLFLSVALAPARLVLPQGDFDDFYLEGELLILLPVVAVCNLVITVPCIWGAFLKAEILVPLAFGWLVYCAFLTLIEFGVLCAMLSPPPDAAEVLLLMYVVNVSQCATVFGTLLVCRLLGFRLVRWKNSPTNPAPPK
jgi:hypothetical protein